jgi:hypothetical protein
LGVLGQAFVVHFYRFKHQVGAGGDRGGGD